MDNLLQQVSLCLDRWVHPQDRLLVAVSGGADSMALLHVCQRLQETFGYQLEVVHVNHGLRQSAKQEQQAVEDYCRQHGIPLHLHEESLQTQRRSEDWARSLRYRFFEEVLTQKDTPSWLVTAHTLSDQAETLLFRLTRGCGPRGAVGMTQRRGRYLKPLLAVSREQVEAYCHSQGLAFAQDESNWDERYARNRIRHSVLPQLAEINPQVQQALGEFCTRMEQLQAYLEQQARLLLDSAYCPGGWKLEVLQNAPPALRQQALTRLVEEHRPVRQSDLQRLEALCKGEVRAVQLGQSLTLTVRKGLLCWQETRPCQPEQVAYPAKAGCYEFPGGYHLELEELDLTQTSDHEKFVQSLKRGLNNALDCDRIGENLFLRTRQAGDKYRPRGRNGSKTLKKLWNEQGIPLSQRQCMPLLAVGNQVVWIWNEGTAEHLQPKVGTRKVLLINPSKKELKI